MRVPSGFRAVGTIFFVAVCIFISMIAISMLAGFIVFIIQTVNQ